MTLKDWLLIVVYPAALVVIGPLYKLFGTTVRSKWVRARLDILERVQGKPELIGALMQSMQGDALGGIAQQLIGLGFWAYAFGAFRENFWAHLITMGLGSLVFGVGTANAMFAHRMSRFYSDALLVPAQLKARLEARLARLEK